MKTIIFTTKTSTELVKLIEKLVYANFTKFEVNGNDVILKEDESFVGTLNEIADLVWVDAPNVL